MVLKKPSWNDETTIKHGKSRRPVGDIRYLLLQFLKSHRIKYIGQQPLSSGAQTAHRHRHHLLESVDWETITLVCDSGFHIIFNFQDLRHVLIDDDVLLLREYYLIYIAYQFIGSALLRTNPIEINMCIN